MGSVTSLIYNNDNISINKHYDIYQENNNINKLRESRKFIKSQLKVTNYCNNSGYDHDLHHFKYKKPDGTGIQCDHDLEFEYITIDKIEDFFKYCYYINLNKNSCYIRALLSNNAKLNICKQLHCGYSALTPLIMAENVSNSLKREYMLILLSYGFKLTENDKLFLYLDVYESIPNITKNMSIIFLMSDIMLPEIKKIIITKLISTYNLLH
jgi:hypothetical protein